MDPADELSVLQYPPQETWAGNTLRYSLTPGRLWYLKRLCNADFNFRVCQCRYFDSAIRRIQENKTTIGYTKGT